VGRDAGGGVGGGYVSVRGVTTAAASRAESAPSFPELLERFRSDLSRRLEEFLEEKRETGRGKGSDRELVDTVGRLIRGGGKRLRPALARYTYRACGGKSGERIFPVAMSLELLHTYLLVHDDIMDHAEVRRGQPAAHVSFRERHRTNGWEGDAGDFGRSVAILVGDLAYTWANELYLRARRRGAEDEGVDWTAVDACFSTTCEEVIRGQYLEMLLPNRRNPDEDELLRVLRLKSGRYSVERPIELGARLAGAGEETRALLATYGRAMGEAFQLQDDVLGVFGRPEAVGKPVGSDLREGKHTLLVHHTLRRADEQGRRRLRRILGSSGVDRAGVEEARAVIRESGGLEAVREMIDERRAEAAAALDGLSLDPEGFAFFAGLIDYLGERER